MPTTFFSNIYINHNDKRKASTFFEDPIAWIHKKWQEYREEEACIDEQMAEHNACYGENNPAGLQELIKDMTLSCSHSQNAIRLGAIGPQMFPNPHANTKQQDYNLTKKFSYQPSIERRRNAIPSSSSTPLQKSARNGITVSNENAALPGNKL